MKFYPHEKGVGKSLSHANGGAQKVFVLFLHVSLKF